MDAMAARAVGWAGLLVALAMAGCVQGPDEPLGRSNQQASERVFQDVDDDGIPDERERRDLSVYGLKVGQRDILVQYNWMEGLLDEDEVHQIWQPIEELFSNQGYKLKVLMGENGGPGGSVVGNQDITRDQDQIIENSYFNQTFWGVARFILAADSITNDEGEKIGDSFTTNGMSLSDGTNNVVSKSVRTVHVLGHIFGIYHDGVDRSTNAESYPSSMNYNIVRMADRGEIPFIGFSDGSHGPDDFDDWAALRIDRGLLAENQRP